MKILLVDDDLDYINYIETTWPNLKENIEIESFQDPERALEKMEEGEYDVVVSDYQMPMMDGLDFLEGVRERSEKVSFVILTGKGDEEVAMKSLNMRADGYVKKDMDPKNQLQIIEDALYEKPVNG
ncbi:MAG: response regulator [Candidatus Hadarchaeota archaeon]